MQKKKPLPLAVKIIALPVWAFLSYFIAVFIASILLDTLAAIFKFDPESTFWTAIYQIVFYGIAVALTIFAPIIFYKKYSFSRTKLGLRGLITWSDIGLAIVGLIAYFILASIIVYLFSLLPFFNAEEAQDVGFNMFMNNRDAILAFLSIVVIAPIAEEIIFRGWLYGKLRDIIPEKYSLVLSILIVSILFGLLHGQLNVAVNVFAMSVVMCLMRETTGTIYSGILLHIMKNAIAFYLMFIMI